MRFRKKPVEIEARRVEPIGEMVRTLNGELWVNEGEWIVTGVMGEQYPITDEILRATYVPADDEARAAMKPVDESRTRPQCTRCGLAFKTPADISPYCSDLCWHCGRMHERGEL